MASGGLPGTHPISSRSTHSLFATGTFLAVGLVLNLSGWVCERSKTTRALYAEFPENLAVSSTTPTPLVFTARGYGDLSSQCWNPGLCSLA